MRLVNPRHIIIFLFHLLILTTPFLWTSQTSELFEFPKIIFTYAMTLLIAGAWLSRMILHRRPIFRRTPLDIPILLFLLSQIISTIFSIDPHTSLWGYYSRFNGGLFSTLAYITLYYALVSNFTRQDAKYLIYTLIAALSLTSLYSFPEHFGYSPSCQLIIGQFDVSCWVQDVQNRVFGTFGQPNWQAAYIVTLIFLPLSLIVNNKYKTKTKITNFILHTSYFILLLLPFSTLLFTKSRSGLLAFLVGFTIFSTLTLLRSIKFNTYTALKPIILASCFMILIFLVFGRSLLPQLNQTINNLNFTSFTDDLAPPPTTSTPSALTGGTESGDIRKIVWQGAIDIFLQYPIFGSGVETFAYSYYNVRPVEHNLVSEWDFLYNKAHNEFLNFAATTGAFGLISYTLIILTFTLWNLYQILITKSLTTDYRLLTAILSGFLALTVSNFFGFSTVSVSMLFFILPALAFTLVSNDIKLGTLSSKFYTLRYYLISFLLPLVIISPPLVKLASIYSADQAFASGKSSLQSGDLQTAITLLQRAHDTHPSEPTYTDQLSLAYAHGTLSLLQANQDVPAQALAQQAIYYSDQTLIKNSVHLNYYKTRTQVFVALSQLEPELINHALNTLNAALTLAPTDAKIWYNLGLLYFQLEEIDQAEELLNTTLTLKPNYEQARLTYAQLLESQDQTEEALIHYQYILDHINPNSPTALEKIESTE